MRRSSRSAAAATSLRPSIHASAPDSRAGVLWAWTWRTLSIGVSIFRVESSERLAVSVCLHGLQVAILRARFPLLFPTRHAYSFPVVFSQISGNHLKKHHYFIIQCTYVWQYQKWNWKNSITATLDGKNSVISASYTRRCAQTHAH